MTNERNLTSTKLNMTDEMAAVNDDRKKIFIQQLIMQQNKSKIDTRILKNLYNCKLLNKK